MGGRGRETEGIEKKGENCTRRKREKKFVFWGVREESEFGGRKVGYGVC